MSVYKKFTVFFLSIIFLSLIASLAIYSLQMFLYQNNPETQLKPYHFSKILSRTATVILFISLIWFRKKIDKKSIQSLGLENFSKRKQQLWIGFLAGILSLSLVVVVKIFFDVSTLAPKTWEFFDLVKCLYFLAAVFCIAFVEELFFRGYLLQSWISDLGEKKASVYTSLFFSLTHFIRPISDPLIFVSEFIGLFLVGYTLSLAWIYTRALYLSIGIHAGWVYVVKMQPYFVDSIPHDNHWVFGGERLVSGGISWMFMIAFVWFLKLSYDRTLENKKIELV
ncbi:CPBP family intramembrane metalloprotease [Leptospira congkakensis]|uniref:CPBP family intramembrane metalloprotease n=1 Tax=Leptospira congkakensis TaxID=2484932 RepID=A0A4Z1A4K1_9LEPT|nr:CPBP family intramembrane glutamic endopeptidase [Leptospira congkakensis]TGL87135.1 CPBP family intramembrane metalloprotease [Leptospira congkakensis]TGL96703.1 CPBP family intramembrane metalloprotease [Leptospira congkakensis]TGL97552.1 CPBP family intramembrane metalloprotease [Leptospira congkakensis]